ncbi:MAG: response regulator [Candidatus Paceibacterota bacterium]|jgi:DNA-binding response OmpR family regulator|nr:response regulator [Candidatus Paceibacterota bacterium]
MENVQKVLIVEDDNFLGDLLIDHLKREGIKASVAKDAETALKMIHQEVPSLVLLDLLLPGMSGLELLEVLQNEDIVPGLCVVILSNLSQSEKIEQAINLGAKDFLVKSSFDLNEITEKVKENLGVQDRSAPLPPANADNNKT